MLLLREDKFVLQDGKLYIVGSASNDLYDNNGYTMGKINVLAWLVSPLKYDVCMLEEYVPKPNIHLILNDDDQSIYRKCKIIKKAVKADNGIIAKMSLNQAIIGCHYAVKYKKIIVIESASDARAALKYHGGHIKYRLASWPIDTMVKHYHKKADYIVYVSQMFLQQKYPSKAVSIGCSDTVLKEPDIAVLQKRIDSIKNRDKTKPFTVGLIGATQAEYRGHDVLISAVGILKKKGYIVDIKFLGGGSADEKRLARAKRCDVVEQVEFCGRLPHRKVLDWIDEIDALVMPTKVESLGRAAIEAMSRACPVIGSVETALRELLGADCLVHAANCREVADKIEKLMMDETFSVLSATENFYRSYKFVSSYTNEIRKRFYDMLRNKEGI